MQGWALRPLWEDQVPKIRRNGVDADVGVLAYVLLPSYYYEVAISAPPPLRSPCRFSCLAVPSASAPISPLYPLCHPWPSPRKGMRNHWEE